MSRYSPSLLQDTKFHRNRIIFHWNVGDMTISKMAAVRDFEFSKFDICGIRPWLLSDFASTYKIFLKSDNTLLSYGRIWRFTIWRTSAILDFKVLRFGHRISVIVVIYSNVYNFIKSGDFSLKCGDITILNMAVVHYLGFPNFKNFHILRSLLSDMYLRDNRTVNCPSYCQNRCFRIWSPSFILEFG